MSKIISYSRSTGQKYPGDQNLACLKPSKCDNTRCFSKKECFRKWVFAVPAAVHRGLATVWPVIERELTLNRISSSGTHFEPFNSVSWRVWWTSTRKYGIENHVRRQFREINAPMLQIWLGTNFELSMGFRHFFMRAWSLKRCILILWCFIRNFFESFHRSLNE